MNPEDPNSQPHEAPIVPAVGDARATADTATLGFSLTRENVSMGRLISAASEAWQRDIGTWALAMFLMMLIGVGVPWLLEVLIVIVRTMTGADANGSTNALLTGLDIGVQILQTAISGVLGMGLWAMAFNALHGRPAPIAALFGQFHKAIKYILQVLAIWVPFGIVVGALAVLVIFLSVGRIDFDMPLEEAYRLVSPTLLIFFLVALPVAVYFSLGILFAANELTFNDRASPIDAIVYSWRIAKGHRWLILGAVIVASLIALASLLMCGVGILFGGPLASLIVASLYLALRDGAEVPEADTRSTFGSH